MISLVSAVFTNTGISKASGQPFTMHRVSVLSGFRDVDSPNFQSHGFGLSAVDLAVANPNLFNEIQKHFAAQYSKNPVYMEFETTLDGDGRNVIVGFNSSYVADAVMTETASDSKPKLFSTSGKA